MLHSNLVVNSPNRERLFNEAYPGRNKIITQRSNYEHQVCPNIKKTLSDYVTKQLGYKVRAILSPQDILVINVQQEFKKKQRDRVVICQSVVRKWLVTHKYKKEYELRQEQHYKLIEKGIEKAKIGYKEIMNQKEKAILNNCFSQLRDARKVLSNYSSYKEVYYINIYTINRIKYLHKLLKLISNIYIMCVKVIVINIIIKNPLFILNILK